MGYDDWLTTTPEDRAHLPECNCEVCHEVHDVRELAGDIDFRCCTEEFEAMRDNGEICPTKPKEHFDIYMAGDLVNGKFILAKPPRCLECEEEKKENEKMLSETKK